MQKSRIAVAIAGVVFSAATIVSLTTSSFGQDRGPAWWWNYWEPGSTEAWDLREMTPERRQRMMRHWTFMNNEVPEDYVEAKNDVGYTISAIDAGGPLYAENCARCHGPIGLGDGEAAGDLTPSPALLGHLVQQPIAVDQYLLWSISEGGREFGTAMPAFKDELTQDEIWQIIAYLRAGLPEVDTVDETAGQPEDDSAVAPSNPDAAEDETEADQSTEGKTSAENENEAPAKIEAE